MGVYPYKLNSRVAVFGLHHSVLPQLDFYISRREMEIFIEHLSNQPYGCCLRFVGGGLKLPLDGCIRF